MLFRLYDYHPEGQEELLLDTIVRLRASGVPWEEVYKEENFPKIEVDNLENPTGYVLSVRNPLFGLRASSRDKLMLPSLPQWHGVNFAEGMKALPAMYRVTANQSGEWTLPFPLPPRNIGNSGQNRLTLFFRARQHQPRLGHAFRVSWPTVGDVLVR